MYFRLKIHNGYLVETLILYGDIIILSLKWYCKSEISQIFNGYCVLETGFKHGFKDFWYDIDTHQICLKNKNYVFKGLKFPQNITNFKP